jgi:hypothetical protein
MNSSLSLSVFTIEIDWKPVVAFACRKQTEAEAICADERIRAKLCSERSGGKPLCDDLAILRVRLAHPDERAMYKEQVASQLNDTALTMTYLVELDDPEAD